MTLEPCCHYGKTPPCTEIIIESGIQKVYIGSMDPNPLVAGKGVSILKQHGIEVVTGVCERECLELNKVFSLYKDEDAVCSDEICYDCRWKDSDAYWRF